MEETISSQTEVDEQVSLLGYFIQTAYVRHPSLHLNVIFCQCLNWLHCHGNCTLFTYNFKLNFIIFPTCNVLYLILMQNCHDLKNFESLFALMQGLKERCHEGTDGWLSVSSQLVSVYYNLCEVVSADMDYLRYRQELRMVNQSSCVPILSECWHVCVVCVCVRVCVCVCACVSPIITHCITVCRCGPE